MDIYLCSKKTREIAVKYLTICWIAQVLIIEIHAQNK